MKASKNTSQINVYIPNTLRKLLADFRAEHGLSESGAIVMILRERLQSNPQPSQPELSKEQLIAALNKLL
jgi:hypothetical protein